MTHRERVVTALSREQPDRVPFQATFCPEFARRLGTELGVPVADGFDPHAGRWNGYDLEKATQQDALQCSIGWATEYYHGTEPYVDEWGAEWYIDPYTTPYGDGIYTNLRKGPLYDPDCITGYSAPDPTRPTLFSNLERLIREEQSEYFIIGRLHTTIFETAWALRGMDNLMMDLILEPERAEAVLQIPFQYHLEVARKMAALGVDMIWLGDDMGAQKSMLISPDMWREFFKPKMATIISEAKAIHPDVLIAYHTDGYNLPIIPDLIEIGLDVLNPIQAESMDPGSLKREFGGRLSFFGAIDVQTTLPFGSPEDVRSEFANWAATLGRGGGWLCAPTHHVQLDTPMENFLALVDAAAGSSR